MAITSADIRHLLSGGATNANPAASLGGVKSSVTASLTLYDNLSVAELAAGDVEYRCHYVKNAHSTLTLTNAVLWINSNTPSNLTTLAVGLGTSAINGTEQVVADESTAPTGVTFAAAVNKAGGIALGDLAPGASRAVWTRRTASSGSVSVPVVDPCTFRVEGETL